MTTENEGMVNPTIPSTEQGGVAIPQPLVLIPVNTEFQGIPVRIVTVNGTQMMPVADIAKALKINRGSLTRSLKDKLFNGKKMDCKVATSKGGQKMTLITSLGAVGLLYKIDAEDVEDKNLGKRVSEFQDFATNLVQKEMQVRAKPPAHESPHQTGAVTDTMHKYMEAARAAHEQMGVPLDLAWSKALVLAGRDLHMDLTGFARLLPPAQDQTARFQTGITRIGTGPIDTQGYLSASEIAQYLNRRNGGNLRGKNINTFLKQHGFIYRRDEDQRYCMTDKGSLYGRVFPFAAHSGHVDYFLRWKPEVMQASGMIRE